MRNIARLPTAALLPAAALLLAALPVTADEELLELITRYSPQYTVFVVGSDGSPLAVVADLNGDGRDDIAVLTVAGDDIVRPSAEHLSDERRLYQASPERLLFILEMYYSGDQAVRSIEFGRQVMLQGMWLRRFNEEGSPLAVEVAFRARESSARELVVIAPGGMVSRLSLYESRNEGWLIDDVDGDGTDDIVVTRRVPDGGRGFETLMELWSVVTGEVRRVASFGLVRALSSFLERSEKDVAEQRWSDLLARVDPAAGEPMPLASVFLPVALDGEDDPLPFDFDAGDRCVAGVVFPRVVDNPFPFPYFGQELEIVFRVECCSALPHLYAARIRLSDNPFVEPRFAFLTHGEAGR